MTDGLVGSSVDWALGLILAFFCLFMLGFIASSFDAPPVDTTNIDPYIYLGKLHYSPDLLYGVDSYSLMPEYGVLSLEKFSSNSLDTNNYYAEDFLAAELLLLDASREPVSASILPRQENPAYNNRELFDRMEPFARRGVRGAGGASLSSFTIPISYRLDDVLQRGFLEITIVRPNS